MAKKFAALAAPLYADAESARKIAEFKRSTEAAFDRYSAAGGSEDRPDSPQVES